jgi:hypothetical protein
MLGTLVSVNFLVSILAVLTSYLKTRPSIIKA